MKKKYIIAIIIGVLLLLGLILVLTLGKDNGKTKKENTDNDVIVHESDDNTVEEEAEGGLQESDSEDGPVIDEDTMIDFNGGDDKPSSSTGNGDDGKNEGEEPSQGEEKDEDSKDTGTWGIFY